MQRNEATNLLKEIVVICDGLNEEAVILVPSNADSVLSHGYQLHIKLSASTNLACIRPLVKKHNLAITEERGKNLLVIYRPTKKEVTTALPQ